MVLSRNLVPAKSGSPPSAGKGVLTLLGSQERVQLCLLFGNDLLDAGSLHFILQGLDHGVIVIHSVGEQGLEVLVVDVGAGGDLVGNVGAVQLEAKGVGLEAVLVGLEHQVKVVGGVVEGNGQGGIHVRPGVADAPAHVGGIHALGIGGGAVFLHHIVDTLNAVDHQVDDLRIGGHQSHHTDCLVGVLGGGVDAEHAGGGLAVGLGEDAHAAHIHAKVIGLPDAVHLGGEVRGEGAEAAAGGDVIDLGLGDIHHVGHVVAVLVPGLQMLHDLQELGGLIVVGNGGGLAVVRQHTQVIGVVAHLVHTGIDENAGAVVRSDQRRVGVLFVYLGEELIQLVQGDGVTVLVAELRGDVGPHGVHGGGGHIQQTGDAIAGSVQVPALKYVFTDGLADLIRVRLDQLSNVHGLAAGNSGGEILDPEHINGIVAGREQQVQLLGLVGVLHHDEFHIGADLFTGDGADGLFDHGHILGHGQAGHHHLNGGVALLRSGGGSLTGPGSGGRLGVAFTGAAGSQGKQHGQRKNAGQHSLDTLLHLFCSPFLFFIAGRPRP